MQCPGLSLQTGRLNQSNLLIMEATAVARKFKECQKILTAIGDENRQHLLIEMMQMNDCRGVRVGDITKRTHLSRPAVSHHLQILKDAGLINVRKEGTYTFFIPT